MKYFILYISYSPDFTQELYIKSKSPWNTSLNASCATPTAASQQAKAANTNQVLSIYAREINPSQLDLNKTKFATINENKSTAQRI